MIDRRRFVLGTAALPLSVFAFAQHQAKVWRVGILTFRPRPGPNDKDIYNELPKGMQALGYVEGKNVHYEWRSADDKHERLPALAAELVRLKVDVIVTVGTVAIRAAKEATSTIPIVMATSQNPIGAGFVASLSRPAGNITGLTNLSEEAGPKQVDLLVAALPGLSRLAVMTNPVNSEHGAFLKGVELATKRAGAKLLVIEARNAQEIERAFPNMAQERVNALLVALDPLFISHRHKISSLAAEGRVATMFSLREHVVAGGLMSYGENVSNSFRRAAVYVDKILKGANPGELPVEQAAKFELVINRKTAKALGLSIPQQLLVRADEVIE